MGILSNLRNLRNPEDGLLLSSSTSSSPTSKRKWSNFLPVFIALVVLVEIAFLGRLDMAKNAAAKVDSWADSVFYNRSPPVLKDEAATLPRIDDGVLGLESCEEWLEREDSVIYSRDFDKDPILVAGAEKEWRACAVGCQFGYDSSKTPDAIFGTLNDLSGILSVHRSMESAQYYPENDIATARGWVSTILKCLRDFRRGYRIVMTTSLSSDVPVGYFSWAEYDIMAAVQPKTEKALAAAFISNCGARNFRLQVLDGLEKLKIPIDSYGACHRNRDGRVNKVEALKHYKFSLAFENSNEEDYVTEKFFQSLVAGTIPVVVGAPNIQDYAPGPGSILHIKSLEDIDTVAKTMNYLSVNSTAYNQSLRWKVDGPSDTFKALVDMATVHSSCRLCIHLATMVQEKEASSSGFKKRPCRCTRGPEIIHHLYVRERGRFKLESIFLGSGNLTMEALEQEVLKKFKSLKHVPIWKGERPERIRGGDDEYKVYRVYPVGLTQREALYSFRFTNIDLQNHLEANPCPKLEVIFV
ncbi:Putative fucosyltransferase-like protein [Linum grandiflorum]